MKKTIAILLVAILAVGSVFALDANLSGKFTSKLAYDIEKNWLGFTEPDNDLDLTLELTTATENEGDVYASVKAEMKLIWETEGDEFTGKAQNETALFDSTKINGDDSKFEITEAAIYGNGWNLSILKAAEMSKYANGWETYNDGDDNVDLDAPVEYKNDLGVTFTLDNIVKAGFSAAVDFDENEGKNFLAWASTDDLNFGGVTVNAAAGVTKATASNYAYIGLGAQAGYSNDTFSVTVGSDMSIGAPTEKNLDATFDFDLAASFAFADMVTVDAYYATDTTLAGADTPIDTYQIDLTYGGLGEDGPVMAFDGIGRGFFLSGYENGITGVDGITYDGETITEEELIAIIAGPDFDITKLTITPAYGAIENYLSTKIGFDLNAFDVPVAFTLVGMDLVNNPYFDLEAKVDVAGFEITAFGGYQALIANDDLYANVFHVGGEVAYTIEPVGKLSAGATYLGTIADAKNAELYNALGLELAIENTTLVSGATLKAGYKTANIIDGDNAMFTADAGEIYVQATIEF